VYQRGTAADCHHQCGCRTADLGSLAPGAINVGATQGDTPQPGLFIVVGDDAAQKLGGIEAAATPPTPYRMKSTVSSPTWAASLSVTIDLTWLNSGLCELPYR